MMARWLLGLKTDAIIAQKTFRMLNAIIENGGDLLEEGKPNPAERSWLRLGAGCAILKICEQKGVGDNINVSHFYNLAGLATDPVIEVREKFMVKLHKGYKSFPYKSLPLDFMGVYALAGKYLIFLLLCVNFSIVWDPGSTPGYLSETISHLSAVILP